MQDEDGEQDGNGAQEGNIDHREEPDQAGNGLGELQTPVQDHAFPKRRHSSQQRNKRSPERDGDALDRDGPSPRKSPRHSETDQEPAILVEPESSQEIPLAEPQDLIPEEDPRQTFESAWQRFLNGIADEDREQWDTLYEQAKMLAGWNLPVVPDGSSDEALEQLQTKLNDDLRQALDWGWEEDVDKVKAKYNGTYHEDDLQQAQLAREGALWRVEQGRSPKWPSLLKPAAPSGPTPEAFPEHE